MATKKPNPAAGAVSLKVLAERKIPGVGKTTNFNVDPRIIECDWSTNARPMDRAHVDEIKTAKRGGAVFPALDVSVDDGSIKVIDGHHRLTADMELIAEGAEIKSVECRHFKGNDAARVAHMLTSASGLPLTPLQRGRKYKELDGFGWDTKRIADRAGKSTQHVLDMIKLATEANSDVQAMVERGEVTGTTALKAVKKHGSGAGKVLAAGLKEAKAKGKKKVTEKNLGKSYVKTFTETATAAKSYLAALTDSPSIAPDVKAAIKTINDSIKKGPLPVTLVEAIKTEINTAGQVQAETLCPEHADLIAYLRGTGAA